MTAAAMAHARQFRRNKITVMGKTGNLKELAKVFGIGYSALLTRINWLCWDLEKALTTPVAPKPDLKLSSEYPGRIFNKSGLLVKECAKCRTDKRLEDFRNETRNSDGLSARCSACEVEYRHALKAKKAALADACI